MKGLLSTFWVLAIALIVGCGENRTEQIYLPSHYSISENALYNSGFDIWQRGTDQSIHFEKTEYTADRWYVQNFLGKEAVIRARRTTARNAGSVFAMRVEVANSPQRRTGDFAVYQTLDPNTSARFSERKVSFSILVQAVGPTTKVGVQLMTNEQESKVTTPLGAERVFNISSDRYTLATVQGVDVGTLPAKGVIGVRIRPLDSKPGTTVQEIENGFILEQAMMNIGPLNGDYRPRFANISQELEGCLPFYEKSYNLAVTPGTKGVEEGSFAFRMTTGGDAQIPQRFQVRKRVVPKVVIYSPGTGAQNKYMLEKKDENVETRNIGEAGFGLYLLGSRNLDTGYWHYTADAEI